MISLVVLICLAGAIGSAPFAAEPGKVLRSAVFPGMGQLGDGQQIKGLSFFTAEVVLLSLSFMQLSKQRALTRETVILNVQYNRAETYDKRAEIDSIWRESYDKSDQAQLLSVVFFALSGACWGANIVDALLFQNNESEVLSVIETVGKNTAFSFSKEKAHISYTVDF
jgi:hypothetical protein